ncbi:MAG: anaerobic ribonucleoside-triphosphate reductase activating protein [bacterium]|nr:anaerobic ribonucleoside-triphosphate reductase activating protein [bacterium]
MIIGGLQKFSLLDYPGKVSAIVFTQGCNFRCQFCYNPMLVWPIQVGKSKYAQGQSQERQKDHPVIKEDDLFVFLKSRLGKLDAVVITGGEPCLQKDLSEFINKIKNLGFLIKLDTNGGYPEALEKLLGEKLIDYIAMDLKATPDKYGKVTGVEADFNKIKKSVKIIMRAGLPYEFRTTVVPGFLNQDDIAAMGKIIKGANKWYLQNFKSNLELVGRDLEGRVPYNSRQMREMSQIGAKFVKKCEVR